MPAKMSPKTTRTTIMMMTAITQGSFRWLRLSAPSVRHWGEQTCQRLYRPAWLLYPARMMNIRTREIVILAVGLALVLGAALGGYAVVRTRADGAPDRQVLAPVAMPTPSASGGSPAPQYERWTVGKATGPVTVLMRPAAGAPVLTRLGKVNQNGYPTLCLLYTSDAAD